MPPVNPKLEAGWLQNLKDEFDKPYFAHLKSFLLQEKSLGKIIYPPGPEIFNAFNFCAFDKLKVVIIGQDPYHGFGQAHGLCFSVKQGVKIPPSLANIFKELASDLNLKQPSHGDLTKWAQQGVLLLNAVLTVENGLAASHKNQGWEIFTDQIIQTASLQKENLVFLLWGNFAIAKKKLIQSDKHLVLTTAHPSPLSAHNGFFGNRHFSKTNRWLQDHGIEPINWELT